MIVQSRHRATKARGLRRRAMDLAGRSVESNRSGESLADPWDWVRDVPPIGESLSRDRVVVLATVPRMGWTPDDVRREYKTIAQLLSRLLISHNKKLSDASESYLSKLDDAYQAFSKSKYRHEEMRYRSVPVEEFELKGLAIALSSSSFARRFFAVA